MHDCESHILIDCTHMWSKEVGVYVGNYPHMLSICTWCAKTRIRPVDPRWLKNTQKKMREATFLGEVA